MQAIERKARPFSLTAAAFALGLFGTTFAISATASAGPLPAGLQRVAPLERAATGEAGIIEVHHFKRHQAKRHHFKHRHFKGRHFKGRHGHHHKRRHLHSRHHHKGKLHGHYRGHSPRHGYAARGGCHEVTKVGHRHGQKALIGGVMCYDGYGRGYVVKGSRYVIRYLHH